MKCSAGVLDGAGVDDSGQGASEQEQVEQTAVEAPKEAAVQDAYVCEILAGYFAYFVEEFDHLTQVTNGAFCDDKRSVAAVDRWWGRLPGRMLLGSRTDGCGNVGGCCCCTLRMVRRGRSLSTVTVGPGVRRLILVLDFGWRQTAGSETVCRLARIRWKVAIAGRGKTRGWVMTGALAALIYLMSRVKRVEIFVIARTPAVRYSFPNLDCQYVF